MLRRRSGTVLLFALAAVIIVWFGAYSLLSISDSNQHSPSTPSSSHQDSPADVDHDHHPAAASDNVAVVPTESRRFLGATLAPRACAPAKVDTEIARFGRQGQFSKNLQSLCATHCRRVDRSKRPDDFVDKDDWQPSFCKTASKSIQSLLKSSRSSSSLDDLTRFDSGCYNVSDDYLDANFIDYGATAIFSTLGTRFFGPGGQEYVWESIRQWRLFHPNAKTDKIFMITNSSRVHHPLIVGNASQFNVKVVGHESLMTDEWRRYDRVFYIQGYMHPGGSRTTGNKDFNRLVTARFFAIQKLMLEHSLRHVVHLENDMMVYRNFAGVVAAARKCGWKMASLFPHFDGVIPGLLYIRGDEELGEFTGFINDLLSCGKKFGKAVQSGYANDMTYLKNFFQLRGGGWLGDLPSVPRAAGTNCVADQMPELLHDGASFGQWYSFAVKSAPPFELPRCDAGGGGADHRHQQLSSSTMYLTSGCAAWESALKKHFSSIRSGAPVSAAKPPAHIRMAMKKGRFVDATPGDLVTWQRDESGRLVPRWGNKFWLSSMHVHAKNLYWFRSR